MSVPNLSVRLYPETIRSLAFGSISGSFAAVGTALANPARIILFQNTCDTDMFISFDVVNSHLMVPTLGFVLLDVTSNASISLNFTIAQGTRFYVKQVSAPSSGTVYISVFYGSGT